MTRLTVAVRVRPLSDREIASKSVSIVSVENGKTLAVTNIKVPEQNAGDSRERVRRFTFDYCFDYKSSQDDVYQSIGKEISKAIKKRFHSCILAYGQSSSGKTHTMMGLNEEIGLGPRLCQNIFKYLAETAVGSEAENLNATVSYLEIYNEKVRDLLESEINSQHNVPLKIREHPKKGPYVQGLSEQTVIDASGLLTCLQIGNVNRTVGATNANPRSSRSHSVFTVTCCGGLKLRLVDLAGSERAGSRSHTTSRFREGSNINKSLVALRNVISALADGSRCSKSRKRFIPYRDSVLTWLLKDTLGGNSKTILISTVSPSSTCYNETVNTLRFGQRAKQIVIQPLVNEDPKERTIRELRAEIAKLKELLAFTHVSTQLSTKESFGSLENIVDNDHILKQNIALEEEEYFQDWETVEDLNSDSGLASPSISFEDEDFSVELSAAQEVIKLNCVKNDSCGKLADSVNKNKISDVVIVVDKLIPVMEVTSNVAKTKPPSPLRRTFSMSTRTESNAKIFGSHEVLSSVSTKKNATASRKPSIEKSTSSLRAAVSKIRDDKSTETNGGKLEVKPRVDSNRKPRKDVVAAVTQRLYNKVKKKEASTDTDDINKEIPKKLSITEGARSRLQELTRKALRAHRRRSIETQTDLYPVLRVKEISTDVDDLKIALEEIKHVEIGTDAVNFKDVGINCSFLETLNPEENADGKSGLILTRTCGTCTSTPEEKTTPQLNMFSFTKYLQAQQDPKFEIVNPSTANPIYTSAVNINVNHNYINNNKVCDNVSDDSLEEQTQANVCFPTPDLISNHNSLEQHAHEASTSNHIDRLCRKDLRYATMNAIPEDFKTSDELNKSDKDICVANSSLVTTCSEQINSINREKVFAPQVCTQEEFDGDYDLFYKKPPQRFKPHIIEDVLHTAVYAKDPTILKSIMKQNLGEILDDSEDDSLNNRFENIPDSLNYYYEKKKVRFDNPPFSDERIFDAMTNFMKEVTTLMTNLTKVASKLDNSIPEEKSFDVQVTVNDIQGMRKTKSRTKKKLRRYSSRESSINSESTTQTSPIRMCEIATEIDEDFPTNKYDAVVSNSCDRLEKLVQNASKDKGAINRQAFNNLHKFPQPFSINTDWNYPSLPEDSSLESNPTFSDYGSLPRKRRETCFNTTPSSYLRQLTTVRREIVKSSRDELLNEAQSHM